MEKNWYYVVGGQERRGPIAEGELKQMIADGRVTLATLVWSEGMAEWAPASTIAALLPPSIPPIPSGAVPPPPPPSGPRLSRTHNRDLMTQARMSLNGRWGNAIVFTLAFVGIQFAIQLFAAIPIIGLLFILGSILIAGALELGLTMFFLSFARGKNPEVSVLFAGFPRFGTALAAYLLTNIFIFLWALLLIVPGIVAACRYAMTYYILADNPTMDAMDAINRSKEMMMGNKWKFFCLGWRFFGWGLLCALTCGVGALFLLPYMQVSISKFYDDLKPAT